MDNKFWNYFSKKDFSSAQVCFDQMSDEEKQSIFSELFQKSGYQLTPNIISVLYRELHEGKTFDDFHQAWMPRTERCKPITIGGKIYQQFFELPTRVINAVNIKNPKEIVSVGMTWCFTKEQEEKILNFATSDNPANKERRDSISEIAIKKEAEIYLTKADDNLGTPFSTVF